ncbi:tumor necrosis factor receptor superfamily member EDAR-like isoform X1 [Acipenser ruthenus]|uniref:tumor necrosis factor receptor superfamily member EDAR-like isoform X1 n=1 Tax=Acipenser ruthenus TaxID=7906 RepID=UPI00274286DE|nr:tumor necrosis factor receptor superfamily member EDAR-like isoform X1 [Acipenser ruthenus]
MDLSEHTISLLVWCVLCGSCSSCSDTQYRASDGSCKECQPCPAGEEPQEDCGIDSGWPVQCVPCEDGRYSADRGLNPCWSCTQCHVQNREELSPCQHTANAKCGRCLKGFFELKRTDGGSELVCIPCAGTDVTSRKECQVTEPPATSMAVIGMVSAASTFALVLLLWILVFITKQIRRGYKGSLQPSRLPDPLTDLITQYSPKEVQPLRQEVTPKDLEQGCHCPDDSPRSLSSLIPEKETPPHSIVINVTTNIKPPSEGEEQEWGEGPGDTALLQEEQMEHQLEEICRLAEGQSLEQLDYDSVHELSLLVDSGGSRALRRLGWALGVRPDILNNLHGFQELFEYLRTSTYIQLPELARAAARIHRADLVDRLHQGLAATERAPGS